MNTSTIMVAAGDPGLWNFIVVAVFLAGIWIWWQWKNRKRGK
jgi:hypothetical protein